MDEKQKPGDKDSGPVVSVNGFVLQVVKHGNSVELHVEVDGLTYSVPLARVAHRGS